MGGGGVMDDRCHKERSLTEERAAEQAAKKSLNQTQAVYSAAINGLMFYSALSDARFLSSTRDMMMPIS